MSEAEIITRIENGVGRITLNRPKAIHALNRSMCETMIAALLDWRSNPSVSSIVVDHSGERGFCAGGDIRMIAESGAVDGSEAREFFRQEYRMNHRLFTYAKPIVAFMDGITMGGGVGISQPAKYRVATENTKFAMPETGIGLFPDVGGGWYLSRLPGRMGQYLAVTGHRIDGAECFALGLASRYLLSAALDEVKTRIRTDPQNAVTVLDDFAEVPPEARLLAHRDDIDRLFASDKLEEIIAALEADRGEWASAQLATIATKSPQAMKVSLKLLADARSMPTFEDEMRQEFAVASHIVQRHDFIEGVRALIVDKDNAPQWNPATIDGVSDHLIDQIFAPLPDDQAWTPY